MPLPRSSPHNKKMETRRKLLRNKKRPLASLSDSKKKVVFNDTGSSRSSKKKRASASDYSGQVGAKSPAMERAEEIQANLEPKFPSMIKYMLPSHVTGGFWLGLPKHFCALHMPSKDTEFILEDETGEEYKTKYLTEKIGLSGGWRGFSIMHNLIEGDVVVFQLVKPAKFKVFIVRSNSLDDADGDLGLLNLEASVTQLGYEDSHNKAEKGLEPLPQDTPQENVQKDTQVVLETNEKCSDGLDSELEEAISRLSESVINFKEVNSLENFTVSMHGLIIDSVILTRVRAKYYELCHSQNSYLHENLLEGLNCTLAAGIISETVNIADAIKACKVSTPPEHISTWDKTLKAFEGMGMSVGFLRAKLKKLLSIGSESKRCREASRERVVKADEEMRKLQDKLLQIREAAKRLDAEIENLTVTADWHDIMFQQEVDAPW